MLKRKERLTRAQFDRSFSIGKRLHSPTLQLIIDSSTPFHGSVVVGKKVLKSAVMRNQARRSIYGHLYAWSRAHVPHATLIVIAKPLFAKLSKRERREALDELLARSRL